MDQTSVVERLREALAGPEATVGVYRGINIHMYIYVCTIHIDIHLDRVWGSGLAGNKVIYIYIHICREGIGFTVPCSLLITQ